MYEILYSLEILDKEILSILEKFCFSWFDIKFSDPYDSETYLNELLSLSTILLCKSIFLILFKFMFFFCMLKFFFEASKEKTFYRGLFFAKKIETSPI